MKKINFKKIISGRPMFYTLLILVAVFLFGHIAWAGIGEVLGNVVGGVISWFIQAVSFILVLLVNVLMDVASYSDFIHAPAVTKGWVVVRDVCNMFFVLILLVIAFATILGKEDYNAKKTLPKLIMAAVLINFSKMFCGLMIDVANVMMLTFINAFKEIGSGNIIDMLGISSVVSIASSTGDITFSQIVVSYIFGLIYVIIATVVVASMLAMLVMRVVMIWIYVVLSPAAFFLQAIPGKGASYAQKWWTEWTSNLIVGPVIAFFLWLSFAALQTGSTVSPIANNNSTDGSQEVEAQLAQTGDTGGIASEAGKPAAFAKFAIAIGLLLGGMKIAGEVGGETGKIMGQGMAKLNKGKALAIGAGIAAAKGTGRFAGRQSKRLVLAGGGNVINRFSDKNPDGSRKGNKVGNFMVQWDKDTVAARKKEKVANREKFLKKIGIGEKSAELGKDIVDDVRTSNAARVVKNAGNFAASGAGVATIISALSGPAGFLAMAGGAGAGAAVGGVRGWLRNKNIAANKQKVTNYKASDEAADNLTITNYESTVGPHTTSEINDYQAASKRKRKMKELDEKNKLNPLPITKGALDSMTSKSKAAKDWVKVAANDPNHVAGVGKNGFYSATGITDGWKRRLDELNKGGGDADAAVSNLEAGILALGTAPKDQAKLEEIAKLIAAWEKGGGVSNAGTIGKLKTALIGKGKDPSTFTGQVLTNYKSLDSQMELKSGTGKLEYDAFANNKDVMGVSFAKLNAKAEAMGLGADYKLDEKAGVNQKIDGVKMDALAITMSGLIDDEIKALQSVGGDINAAQISKLNIAKSRLLSGDVSGMSLMNSDVEYKGANDSERRANRYNTLQHENMHQAGARNEELVDESADALQERKLIGNIPGTKQRYDEEIGKVIASMEATKVDPEIIRAAVASKIDEWAPSNAKRVVETETGNRDALAEVAPVATKVAGTEDVEKAINKLTESLGKPIKMSGAQGGIVQGPMSISDRNFFYKAFEGFKKVIRKDDQVIIEKLKPLTVMANNEEKRRNPKK
jgi:hypothetical protein